MEEGAGANLAAGSHHHLLDWLEDSVSFIPSFLDDPYAEINTCEWWNHDQEQADLQIPSPPAVTQVASGSPPPVVELSKKRKQPVSSSRSEEESEVQRRKKPVTKVSGGNGSNGGKEARWAEQLLAPCVAAVMTNNLSRVQHLLYVLRELAAPTGDANHRLAAHGFRALANHLSSMGAAAPTIPSAAATRASYAATEVKLFRSALIKFHEVSPWFALPNALANTAIMQSLDAAASGGAARSPAKQLHIIDVGVSHGVQWPTLLEALAHRSPAPPPLVQITVVAPAPQRIPSPSPFSSAPPDYDFSAPLLRYAKSIELNLRINRAEAFPSAAAVRRRGGDEVLVVCAQFRLGHTAAEEREAVVASFAGVDPDLVILSEVDWGDAEEGSGRGFLAGFARRAGMLWKFLESTGAAFKGRESPERRTVEGEAAAWLEVAAAEMEGAAEWRDRMSAAGFREDGLRDEAVDASRALLRKYDSNWEIRPAAAAGGGGGGLGLRWKGHPVSSCTFWKLLHGRRTSE